MTSLLEMSFVLSEDQNGPVKALQIHKDAGLHAYTQPLRAHPNAHTDTHMLACVYCTHNYAQTGTPTATEGHTVGI